MKKANRNFPVIQAIFISLLFIAAAYLFLESAKWYDYARLLEAENTRLNETLVFTQQRLENETALSNTLRSELADTKRTLAGTELSLGNCTSELSEREEMLGVCTSRNEELTAFLLETREELQNLSGELASFQNQIAQSMSWFTENSNLVNMSPRLQYLADKCTSNSEINAPCIPIAVKAEEGWDYKIDEGDRLLSLDEFAKNKGGDCEDWSLYFKAAYNYLKHEDRPERDIISAVPGIGNFRIYGDHYYADAQGRDVGTTKDYAYIICYDSHCIVAFSPEEIKNSGDVYKLRGVPALEPQNGQYMFTIGNLLAPDICSEEECSYYDIWMIITDDDIYDFHYNWQWVSYRDYYDAAAYYKNRIDAMESLISEEAS